MSNSKTVKPAARGRRTVVSAFRQYSRCLPRLDTHEPSLVSDPGCFVRRGLTRFSTQRDHADLEHQGVVWVGRKWLDRPTTHVGRSRCRAGTCADPFPFRVEVVDVPGYALLKGWRSAKAQATTAVVGGSVARSVVVSVTGRPRLF